MTTISIDEYIKILELPAKFKTMTQDEQLKALNCAWRAYSRKWHPDLNRSANAEAKFKIGNEAHEKLVELVKSGSIRYTKTESKQEYHSYKTESDVIDEAVREFFNEFDEREKRKQQEQREELINVIIGVLVVVSAILIGMVCVLGWELTVLIIANALCGAVGLFFKKSQSA